MIVPSSLNDGATEFQRKFNGVVDRSKEVLISWSEWIQDDFGQRRRYEKFLDLHRNLDSSFTRWLHSQNSQQRYYFDQICKKLYNVVDSRLRPLNCFAENLLAREEDIEYRVMATIAHSLEQLYDLQSFDVIRPTKKMMTAAQRLISEFDRISPEFPGYGPTDFISKIAAGKQCILVLHEPKIDSDIWHTIATNVFSDLFLIFDFDDGKKVNNSIIQLFLRAVSIDVDDRQLRRWITKRHRAKSIYSNDWLFKNMELTDDKFDECLQEIKRRQNRRESDQSLDEDLEILKRIKLGQYRTEIPSNCPVI